MANKQEKETPSLCKCGRAPISVQHHGKKMLSCPAQNECSIRGAWSSNEQEAVRSWNDAVKAARHKRGGETCNSQSYMIPLNL